MIFDQVLDKAYICLSINLFINYLSNYFSYPKTDHLSIYLAATGPDSPDPAVGSDAVQLRESDGARSKQAHCHAREKVLFSTF